jgi:hypothetical protein
MSTGQPNDANWSTSLSDNGNLKARFDKTKFKCYNCENMGYYARDYWNPTRRVKKNVNLVVEKEKEVILLLVHDE